MRKIEAGNRCAPTPTLRAAVAPSERRMTRAAGSRRRTGRPRGGRLASVAGVVLEGGYAFRGGRVVSERTAAHVASFEVDGKPEEAVSIDSSEHFGLPRPRLRASGQQGRSARLRPSEPPTSRLAAPARGSIPSRAGLVGENAVALRELHRLGKRRRSAF
jgi:hypothetical protein